MSSVNVLIVDDKPENLYLLRALLTGNGFSVTCANEGGEALRAARSSRPDLIVSDILMPGMDGFALCREWKKDPDLRTIPFVFYTATYTDPRDEKLALDMGADRFLIKPTEPEVFMEQIRSLLAEYEAAEKVQVRQIQEPEETVMREYNQVLVRKLEEKVAQLEDTVKRLDASERDLERANRILRTIFDSARDGILLADAVSRRFRDANAAMCDMLGYSLEELRERTVEDIHPPEELPLILDGFDRLVRRELFLAEDIPVRRRDGGVFFADVHASVVDLEGQTCLMGIFHDITARKRAEERICDLLREKETLLREVHHRIKNNMSSITGLLRLQAQAEPDSAVARALEEAANRVRSMVVLYDKLYRSESIRDISLKEYLLALIDDMSPGFPGRTDVTVETAVEDVVLEANLVFPLGILVTELITNAMKHAFPERERGTVRISAGLEGKNIVLVCEDDGVGLPEGVTLDNSPGFGFHLVRMLVRQMRGTILVERKVGTRFRIEFAIRRETQ
jgi:PAS domain S-box-containing protein